MKETELYKILKNLSKKLPKFPDGRINYSDSDTAVVLTIFIKYKDKMLILKRSNNVATYKGKWNTVAGYVDEPDIDKKILEELKEELNLDIKLISEIKKGEAYEFKDSDINKTWIIQPVLVELKLEPKIRLDREHTEFKWIRRGELDKYGTVPNLEESLKRVIS